MCLGQVRVQDVLSVIKLMGRLDEGQLASEPAHVNATFKGRLDMGNVGVMGHSFGGATVLQVCCCDVRRVLVLQVLCCS